jgi:hypothetical protein
VTILKTSESETLIHKEKQKWRPVALNTGFALETQENDIVEVQSTGKPLWCLNRIRPMLILFIDFVDGRVSGYLS